jgi:hypothetical protein
VRSLENQGTIITVELPTVIRSKSFSSKPEETNNVFNPSRLEGFLNVKKEEIEVSS